MHLAEKLLSGMIFISGISNAMKYDPEKDQLVAVLSDEQKAEMYTWWDSNKHSGPRDIIQKFHSIIGTEKPVLVHIDEIGEYTKERSRRSGCEHVDVLKRLWQECSKLRYVNLYFSSKTEDLTYIRTYRGDSPTNAEPLWLGTFDEEEICQFLKQWWLGQRSNVEVLAKRIRQITGGVPRMVATTIQQTKSLNDLSERFISESCRPQAETIRQEWDKLQDSRDYVSLLHTISRWKFVMHRDIEVSKLCRCLDPLLTDAPFCKNRTYNKLKIGELIRLMCAYIDTPARRLCNESAEFVCVCLPQIATNSYKIRSDICPALKQLDEWQKDLTPEMFERVCVFAMKVQTSLLWCENYRDVTWADIFRSKPVQRTMFGKQLAYIDKVHQLPCMSAKSKDMCKRELRDTINRVTNVTIERVSYRPEQKHPKIPTNNWGEVLDFLPKGCCGIPQEKSHSPDAILYYNCTESSDLRYHVVALQFKYYARETPLTVGKLIEEMRTTFCEGLVNEEQACSLVVLTTTTNVTGVKHTINFSPNNASTHIRKYIAEGVDSCTWDDECIVLAGGARVKPAPYSKKDGYRIPNNAEVIILPRAAMADLLPLVS
jgi:hypothetical protein